MLLKKNKIPKYITGNIQISSDSDREDFDEEYYNEKNCHEGNFDEEN